MHEISYPTVWYFKAVFCKNVHFVNTISQRVIPKIAPKSFISSFLSAIAWAIFDFEAMFTLNLF